VNWCLGWVGNKRIVTARKLTDSERERYEDAAFKLRSLWKDQGLFALVLHNYQDYDEYLKRISEARKTRGSLGPGGDESAILHLNRYILNYLAAVRTFLDHTELRLKRRYGENSPKVDNFREACAREYDTHFSYRFLYSLRNYVLHCGLPIGHAESSTRVTDLASWRIEHSLTISFARDSLLQAGFDWKAQLRQEILNLPSEFPIHPHMAQMMACLNMINLALISDNMPELLEAARFIEALVSSMQDCKGTPCLLRERPRSASGQIPLDIALIPFDAIELVLMLATTAPE
jgi:hypothetical protein